jgi:multiple sugar transport system permease protein
VTTATTPAAEAAPKRRRGQNTWAHRFGRIVLYVALIIVFVGPIWAVLATAFSPSDVRPGELSIVPDGFTFSHVANAWSEQGVARYMFNSLVVVGGGLVLQVAVSTFAAYALARKRFRGSATVLFLILCTMMLPEEVIAVPLYLVLGDIPLFGTNLLNTYAGMILPVVGWAFSIFILTQFMRQIPDELEEAARIDGAKDLTIFFRIVIPLVRPALATVTVFGFIMIWDQYMLPLIVAQDNDMFTLPVALQSLRLNDQVDPSVLMASAFLALLPTLIVYLLLQRHYERGLTAGATKG